MRTRWRSANIASCCARATATICACSRSSLEIVPEPMSLRWIHDVFGNSVAIATFDERAETLSFGSTATVEHNPAR